MATRVPALIQLSDPRVAAQLVYNYGKVDTLVMYQSWDKTDIYKTGMSTVQSEISQPMAFKWHFGKSGNL